ncbi:ricin-type beta-trefoil lectin domain protein [Paludibacterium purpuratum]|uniref:Astacin (Peptidase family M12A) n=1 Tax=Paludibacterium purpuratum TaxID=1144873 RepID=A0A4R7BCH0_9NEIS|nr:ricin-type beta-trefoil lectin domain protein [Paludibacterium purpuratum]TDR81426.1 astacin (peptidase family M12A) [Paludibacterium purpuratum]
MQEFFCTRRVLFALSWLFAPSAAWGHAMPHHFVADRTWYLWENGVVYFEFESLASPATRDWNNARLPIVADKVARQEILDAMNHIQTLTNKQVVFIDETQSKTQHPDRLKISLMPWSVDKNICGKASQGRGQSAFLQIADTPHCKNRALAVHELMHVLGFSHENERINMLMDKARTQQAQQYYADNSIALDFDSITYSVVQTPERLDKQRDPMDVLRVRMRQGLMATGNKFQELSKLDQEAIKKYYAPDETIQRKLTRAGRPYQQWAMPGGRCLAAGPLNMKESGLKEENGRRLHAAHCNAEYATQRWALLDDGSVHNLAAPTLCLSGIVPTQDASLERCNSSDPKQRWRREGGQIVNQTNPQLQLSYHADSQRFFAWPVDQRFQAQWQPLSHMPTERKLLEAQAIAAANVQDRSVQKPSADPWSYPVRKIQDDAAHLYVFKNRQQCLTAEPGDAHLLVTSEHYARLRPCNAASTQQWLLRQGQIVSNHYRDYCLGNISLAKRADDEYPIYAGLQRCDQRRRPQKWELLWVGQDHRSNDLEVYIASRINPIVRDDFRVLEAAHGFPYFGYTRADRSSYTWLAARTPAGATPLPLPQQIGATGIAQVERPIERQIVLQGGVFHYDAHRKEYSAPRCLSVLDETPWSFAAGEKRVDVRECASRDKAQRWTLNPDATLVNDAFPGFCLGRNRNKLGQASLYNAPGLGYKSTGYAALQPCRPEEPSQRWAWYSTRKCNVGKNNQRICEQKDERANDGGDQLLLRDNPKLSLRFHARSNAGQSVSIGVANPSDQYESYRWRYQQPAGTTSPRKPMAPDDLGARPTDWMAVQAKRWALHNLQYVGDARNMAPTDQFRALRWRRSSIDRISDLCLAAKITGQGRIGVDLANCQASAREQRWRFESDLSLRNLHYQQCLVSSGQSARLEDCGLPGSNKHWLFDGANQLANLDWAPNRLAVNNKQQVEIDDKHPVGHDTWHWDHADPARR